MYEKRASPGSARALSSQTAWSRVAVEARRTRPRGRTRSQACGGARALPRRAGAPRVDRAPRPGPGRASGRGSCAAASARARWRSTRGGTGRPRAAACGARSPMTTSLGVHAVTRSVGRHRADDQRVVADGREALRDAGEQAAAVVVDRAQAPVHDLGRVLDRAARDVGERLVAEADAEHRQPARAARRARRRRRARARGGRGPGEMTMLSTASAASSSHDSSSLRTTIGSSPLTSPSRWKRLKVNES